MVKDSELEGTQRESVDYRDIAKVVTKSVSTCILVWVTADTARRAAIYILSAKV